MFINEKHYNSIWLDDKDNTIVKFINQHHLPFRFVVDECRTPEDAYFAIKDMKVRGAPLIGITAAFGIYLAAREASSRSNPVEHIQTWTKKFMSSRPTAVNLSAALEMQLKAIRGKSDPNDLIQITYETSISLWEKERQSCYQIAFNGFPILKDIAERKGNEPVNILTHCNAGWLACVDYGTATAPIYLAHDKGIPVHVWVDETRPRNQGSRLTAWELGQHGVPHTVIVDNAGGYLMQQGKVDIVIVGSDRTSRSGDVANKIGTYLKALAAKDNDIPFYVALPFTSIDFTISDGLTEIPIEERDGDEVRFIEGKGEQERITCMPEDSPVSNYGFDVTPARLVTGLITEKGICKASSDGIIALFPK